jgi:CBS domain containing-hemolysin-like protein
MFKIGAHMDEIQVKEIMIPISDYVTVQKEDTLVEVLQSLEQDRTENGHAHRDAIVVDTNGVFIGKITMIDIFRVLEPNYKKVEPQMKKGILTAEFVMKAARDFNLWMEPTKTICERGGRLKVAEVMHIPSDVEYINEADTLEKALHLYVVGVHQPLIVQNDDSQVTGVLRFGDIFEVVRQNWLNCNVS